MYKHNFICLSETYLNSSVSDSLLKLDRYNLVRADHTNDIKRGGVCIYYKESLPAGVIYLSYFEEALLLEMTYHNKNLIVSVIYRSPSQSINEFDSFLSNLEKLVSDINNRKPALSIQVTLMQDLSPGGLMILIPRRDQNCLHYLPQMVFLD